jgi:hypothetical protein
VGAEEEQGENMFSTRGKTVLAVMTALFSIFFYTKRFTEKNLETANREYFIPPLDSVIFVNFVVFEV